MGLPLVTSRCLWSQSSQTDCHLCSRVVQTAETIKKKATSLARLWWLARYAINKHIINLMETAVNENNKLTSKMVAWWLHERQLPTRNQKTNVQAREAPDPPLGVFGQSETSHCWTTMSHTVKKPAHYFRPSVTSATWARIAWNQCTLAIFPKKTQWFGLEPFLIFSVAQSTVTLPK